MVCGVFTVNGISDADVAGVVQRFKQNVPPPLSVTQKRAGDGTWTVVATFPPCPDNTSHSPGG